VPVRLYVVAARVPAVETVPVGALGELRLQRGWYAYVGSARRGRAARVARHLRADKPLRWHADHLFSRHQASVAWFVDGEAGVTECGLAAMLAAASGADLGPAGFGASDCGCRGHLLRFTSRAALLGAVADVGRRGPAVTRYRPPQQAEHATLSPGSAARRPAATRPAFQRDTPEGILVSPTDEEE
jgi:Uri superfamily endonuclease